MPHERVVSRWLVREELGQRTCSWAALFPRVCRAMSMTVAEKSLMLSDEESGKDGVCWVVMLRSRLKWGGADPDVSRRRSTKQGMSLESRI